MNLKDRTDIIIFVLWKDHYGFNENGFGPRELGRKWQHSLNSVQEVMPA